MNLPIRTRIIYNVKHSYVICMKFGEKFLTSLTKPVLKSKDNICSAIKENLLLYFRKFSQNIFVFITRFVSQRNTACNRKK